MFDQDELLPVSALQHVVFCERQFALIHVEHVWDENVLTVEGRLLHEKVDAGEAEARRELRIARSVPLRSLRFGLVGLADVVEFRRDDAGCVVPGVGGRWRPCPVDYKRGRPKRHRADEVQVCAQGLCLEEMLDVEVPYGALYYARTRRRKEVGFDKDIRELVEEAADRARGLLQRCETPVARPARKCASCSLLDRCRPEASFRSARRFIEEQLRQDFTPEVPGAEE